MKKIKANYVSLFYNSSIGYSLLIQEVNPVSKNLRHSSRIIFSNPDEAIEYLEEKVGKVMARGFLPCMEAIKGMIIAEIRYDREVISPCYTFEDGEMKVGK
jgi:hypothetical protein